MSEGIGGHIVEETTVGDAREVARPDRVRWEYLVRTLDPRGEAIDAKWSRQLDQLGAQGWELVSTTSAGANFNTAYLKRRAN